MGGRPPAHVREVQLRDGVEDGAHQPDAERPGRVPRGGDGHHRRQGVQQAEVGGWRAPRAACAGDGDPGARAHVHRVRRRDARGRRGGRGHRPQRHHAHDGAVRRRGRAEREQGGDRGGPAAQAHRDPHLLHGGAHAAPQPREGHADPPGQALRAGAREAAGGDQLGTQGTGGLRGEVGEDPHVQLQGQPRERPPRGPEL
mmetsp:Transcript_3698/g.12940  ORF Transcript_3698/g.12940 Transcript_3698/m.12940 type:complete len:200 (-) Transcript_3698:792-1391(-)